MANHPSALKAQRQNSKRRARNRTHQSALRSSLKRYSAFADEGNSEEGPKILSEMYSKVDQAVKKKVLSKNAAARHKSRFTKRLNANTEKTKP
jgi:small subunit ribosomal protein S20